MKSESLIPHSQGLPTSPILGPVNKFLVMIDISLRSILILSSHVPLDLPKGLFQVVLPVKILKAFLSFSILTT